MGVELKDVLSSKCGFQHVPLDITRGKLKALVAGARRARERVSGSKTSSWLRPAVIGLICLLGSPGCSDSEPPLGPAAPGQTVSKNSSALLEISPWP